MEVAFVAQTESCSYLLDADGICRWVIPSVNANENARQVARRCVGAQYVASLDPSDAALLVHDPKPGRALVFARLDEKGRVSLLRSGTLTEFAVVDAPAPAPAEAEAKPIAPVEAAAPEVEAPPAEAKPEPVVEAKRETDPDIELQPPTVQYPEDVPPPMESDEEITIEGIRVVEQAEYDAGVAISVFEDEDNGETVQFTRERPSTPTLRGVAPPAVSPVVIRRRGVLPRRGYTN